MFLSEILVQTRLAYTAVSRSKGKLSFVNMSEQQLLESLDKPATVKNNVYQY